MLETLEHARLDNAYEAELRKRLAVDLLRGLSGSTGPAATSLSTEDWTDPEAISQTSVVTRAGDPRGESS
jgi:hypothetical protein